LTTGNNPTPNELNFLCHTEDYLRSNRVIPNSSTSGNRKITNKCDKTNSREGKMAELIQRTTEYIRKQRQESEKWLNETCTTCTTDNLNITENQNATINSTNHHNPSYNNGLESNNNNNTDSATCAEKIVQWNVNGFYTRLDDIYILGWSGSIKKCEYPRDRGLKRKILVPIERI
jgi:hypothetical protein